jgi:hypothetical protein
MPHIPKIQCPLGYDLCNSTFKIRSILETLDLILMIYGSLRVDEGRVERPTCIE